MKEILKKSLIPIVFMIIAFPIIIIYFVGTNNEVTQKQYDQEVNGIITLIRPAGKGAYKLYVKQQNEKDIDVQLSGLGSKEDDILIYDSISKKRKDTKYYIYRKGGNAYSLVYTTELPGKILKEWD